MGQDAPPPLIQQHSRNSHRNDETLGKYIHTKKKNRKNLFFFFLLAFLWTHHRFKAAFGGVAFRLEKIETEIHHRDG
jgi:hypothetical protein